MLLGFVYSKFLLVRLHFSLSGKGIQYCQQVESYTYHTNGSPRLLPLARRYMPWHLARSLPTSKPSSPCQHEYILIPCYVRPPVITHATQVDSPSRPSSRNVSYLSRFTCPVCLSISSWQIACIQQRNLRRHLWRLCHRVPLIPCRMLCSFTNDLSTALHSFKDVLPYAVLLVLHCKLLSW
jgi:hypothetical protein